MSEIPENVIERARDFVRKCLVRFGQGEDEQLIEATARKVAATTYIPIKLRMKQNTGR
jgi:hypothetical protein